jgi:PST family polysaccharide transporter
VVATGGLRAQAARGVFWSAVQRWGTSVVTFVNFTVLARLLGPETYGLVALAAVLISFGMLVLEGGFPTAIVQRSALEPAHLDTAFWTTVAIGLVLSGASALAAPYVARVLDNPGVAPILPWMSLCLLFSCLGTVQQAVLLRELAFRSLAIRSLVAVIAGAAVAQPMAFAGYGVWSLVVGQLVTAAAGTAVLWRASAWRPGLAVSRRHFDDLFGFGSRTLGSSLLSFLETRSSDLLIGRFLGSAALGLYGMSSRIMSMLLDVLIGIGSQVSLPAFSKLQGDRPRMRGVFLEITRLCAMIAVPCFAALALGAPEVVSVLFGSAWAESIPALRALCIVGFVQAVFFPTTTVFLAMGRADWNLRLQLAQTVSTLVIFVLVVRFGILAVALGYAARVVLMAPIRIALVRRLLGFSLQSYLRCYASPVAATLAAICAALVARGALPTSVPVSVVFGAEAALGMVVYAVATRWLAPAEWGKVFEFVRLALPAARRR